MKIALIGPGIMPIPTVGWGAVESIIWQMNLVLTEMGHSVTIFNTKDLQNVANEINGKDFDFVHLHYDEYIPYFNQSLRKPYCVTSHYGFIMQPQYWGGYYNNIFAHTLHAPGIISLWEVISHLYKDNNYNGKLYTLRNGTEVNKFKFSPNLTEEESRRWICVGKVESRKGQVALQRFLDGKVNIDFVGPIGDTPIVDGKTTRYLGPWNKDQLYSNLTHYNGLILLSNGEAAPLVVPEAYAAGLNVIASIQASANLVSLRHLDCSDNKDNVFIIKNQNDLNDLEKIMGSFNTSPEHRSNVRKCAEEYYDWKIIAEEYLDIINDFNS